MNINEEMKRIIKEEGRTQKWVLQEMNKMDPSINLNDAKFSAIMTGRRNVSAEEFLAFCQVVRRSPEIFTEASGRQETA